MESFLCFGAGSGIDFDKMARKTVRFSINCFE